MAEDTEARVEAVSTENKERDYSGLTDTVSNLVDVMRRGDLERLEVSQGDLHILLCAKSTSSPNGEPSAYQPQANPAPAAAPEPVATRESVWHEITSPMVGTYYEAPSPGEPPFVREGDVVEVGQTVAIIEAMKIMNEIVADRPGVIDAVLVENGETVEFGHPLIRLRPA